MPDEDPPQPETIRSDITPEGVTKKMTAGGGLWEPPTVEEAALLFPGYEVLGLLGRGGMGAVYQARQIELDRLVAIKLLPLEISADVEFADRFRREARAMAKLNHPNIISVYDFGTTSAGHLFFVMEFVEGANLHAIIRAQELSADQALWLAGQVCTALAYAHGKGVVHRDIKPANVMVDTEGNAKVADFGLARLTDAGAENLGHTQTGTVMGTPDYMAPEQMRGMNVDHRADIYSLGVMLYEMLCREVPRGIFSPPSVRTGCDGRIDSIVVKAMQSEPERRYQSTQEMQTDVEAARVPMPTTQPHAVARSRAVAPKAGAPPSKKSSTLLYVAMAVGMFILGGLVLIFMQRGKPKAKVAGAKPEAAPSATSRAELPTFGGHSYKLVSDTSSWTEAKRKAEALGGHLLVIDSREENEWIRRTFVEQLEPGTMLWLGASNSGPDGKWKWVTGEEIVFSDWVPNTVLDKPGVAAGFVHKMTNEDTNDATGWGWWRAGEAPTGTRTASRNRGFIIEWDAPPPPGAYPGASSLDVFAADPTHWKSWMVEPITQPGWQIRSGVLTVSKAGWVPLGDVVKDSAVRITCRMTEPKNGPQLGLRLSGRQLYRMGNILPNLAAGKLSFFDQTATTGVGTALLDFPLPRAIALGQSVQMELRAIGSTLTGYVDGKPVFTHNDARLGSGSAAVFLAPGIEVTRLETLDFSKAIPATSLAASSPGAGTKPSPTAAALGVESSAPIPIERGWKPLITASTTPPHRPGRREWSDKRLHLLRESVNAESPQADGAIRARIHFQEGSRSVGMVARSKSTGEAYKLSLSGRKSVFLNVLGAGGQILEGLGHYDFPKPLAAGDVLTLELRAQGDRLTGLVNGTAVVEARDTRYPDAGTWGILADDGWFETAEVRSMAAAPAAMVGMASEPSAIKLWSTEAEVPKAPGVRWEDDAVRLDEKAALIYRQKLAKDLRFGASVRMNPAAQYPTLMVRRADQQNLYRVSVATSDQRVEVKRLLAGNFFLLGKTDLPRKYGPDEWLRVEVECIGAQLRIFADGKLLVTHTDTALADAGMVSIYGEDNCHFRDVVYVPLDKAANTPAPAAAANLKSGAIKLWQNADEVAKSGKGKWENDALALGKDRGDQVLYSGEPSRDVIFRASILATSELKTAVLRLRVQGAFGKEGLYKIGPQEGWKHISVHYFNTQGAQEALKLWPIPRTYRPDEWMRLEVRAIGDELTVFLDGQELGSVRDQRLLKPGGVGLWGSPAGISYFRDVEYVPLDKPSVAAATPAPEPGAIKLWDSPEKLPQQNGVRWENGVVHLEKGSIKDETRKSRDAILRADMRMNPDARDPALGLIRGGTPGNGVGYALCVQMKAQTVALNAISETAPYRPLKSWPLPRAYRADEWARLELRMAGDEITALMDGQTLGSVRDSAHAEPGGVFLFGGGVSFRDIVYVPLDKAGSPAAAESAAAGWQPLVTPQEKPERFQNGLLHVQSAIYKNIGTADGAIRATFQLREDAKQIGVVARSQYPQGEYKLYLNVGWREVYLRFYPPSDANGVWLGTYAFPTPPRVGDKMTLELRAEGDRLTGIINGVGKIEVRDDRIKTGRFGVMAKPGWFETVEVRPLAAAAAPNENWRDWVAEERARGGLRSFESDGTYIQQRNATGGPTIKANTRDGAIRITWKLTAPIGGPGSREPAIVLRHGGTLTPPKAERYMLNFARAGLRIDLHTVDAVGNPQRIELKSWPLPAGFDPAQEHTMELRAVGDELSVRLNGQLIGTHRDSRATAGGFGFFPADGALIRKVEYLCLAPASPDTPAPTQGAAAAK